MDRLMPLDAGDLVHRVSIIRETITRLNGAETRTVPPTPLATPWALVEFLSGSEAWKAQQVSATVNVKITMRYRTDVLSSDRVEWNGWRMEIKSLIPDEADLCSLVLMCEAKRA